ncbi:aryl-sulfate sulfotransferase [Natronomonas gomsonensis]|uniref:aryl-sulfate sulfotransferase n=1 Tax=Natronomonas gomsonensis TaxID=1046043 RepID=UPI0015BD665E|nr:aryl-sulfate sulfotransferase [Natronomonas gomsonensis]
MDVSRVDSLSRRVTLRVVLAVLVFVLLLPAAYAAVNPQTLELGAGTVEEPAAETTYVSVQGFHFAGYGKPKKPARLVAADENGSVAWRFDGDEVGARWFYDIDPTADGDLFVTATYEGGTVVFEYDTATEAVEWRHDMPGRLDTHDTTRLSEDRILVAHMRNTRDGVSDDRLYVENTTTGDTEWEWLFREHYPNGTDGGFDADWTHVNDVDVVGPDDGYVLASPRNFDQVILLNRSSGDIAMRLGSDGDHDTLFEQHNPDYLERDDGTPVILVSDSENDRVVEYERDCGDADPRLGAGTPPESCEWDLVWSVEGFNWPRDADRLPNGNTLVTDTLNHRVVEITPEGEVVWEFYAAWAPYDAERGQQGSNGPTMADHGTTGSYTVSGGGDGGVADRYHVADAIADVGSYTPLKSSFDGIATRYSHVEPWFRPVWMGSWTFLSAVLGVLLALGWAACELLARRERLLAELRSLQNG